MNINQIKIRNKIFNITKISNPNLAELDMYLSGSDGSEYRLYKLKWSILYILKKMENKECIFPNKHEIEFVILGNKSYEKI